MSEPIAVVLGSDGRYILAYSESELELHREMHERKGWPYTVYRLRGVIERQGGDS